MSGWGVLIWSIVCGSGVLTFLTLVAPGLDEVSRRLRQLERREHGEYRRRLEKAAADG